MAEVRYLPDLRRRAQRSAAHLARQRADVLAAQAQAWSNPASAARAQAAEAQALLAELRAERADQEALLVTPTVWARLGAAFRRHFHSLISAGAVALACAAVIWPLLRIEG